MPTIEEAKQALENARYIVQQKRQEAQEAEQKLKASEQNIPQATQQSLRGGAFYGIQGRQKLREAEAYSTALKGKQGELSQYQQELQKYETEQLTPYEQQISQAEKEQRAYNTLSSEIDKTIQEYEGQYTSAKSIRRIQEAFQNAGLDSTEAVATYENSVINPSGRYSLFTNDNKFLGTVSTEGKVKTAPDYTYLGMQDGGYQFQQNLPPETQPAVISNVMTSQNPFFNTNLQGQTKEYYNPNTKMFQTVSPTGEKGTAYMRPPTPEEQYKIDLANYKGSYSQFPLVKFLGEEYGWQKKMLGKASEIKKRDYERFKDVPFFKNFVSDKQGLKPNEYRQAVNQATFGGLYKSGNAPALLLKGFQTGGEKYFNAIDVGRTKVFGGKPTSPDFKKLGGELLGEVGLWTFFTPLISSGEAGTEQVEVPVKRVKKINLSKFKALEDFYAQVESEIIQKESGMEQTKYLYDLYNKYFKDKVDGKDAFYKLVKALTDREIYKIPIEITSTPIEEIPVVDLPAYMKAVGETGATLSLSSLSLNNRFANVGKMGSAVNINQGNQFTDIGKIWTTPAPKEKTISKALSKTASGLALGILSGLKETTGQQNKQTTEQPSAQSNAQSSAQSSAQRSAQRNAQSNAQQMQQLLGLKQSSEQQSKQKTQQRYKQEFGKFFLPRVYSPKISKKVNAMGGLDLFGVYGKRRGRDILLGLQPKKTQAENQLRSFLKGTLGASGFITKGKKPIKIDLGMEFRPAKRQPLRVVQKRKYRLGTRAEVAEIMGTRRGRIKFL